MVQYLRFRILEFPLNQTLPWSVIVLRNPLTWERTALVWHECKISFREIAVQSFSKEVAEEGQQYVRMESFEYLFYMKMDFPEWKHVLVPIYVQSFLCTLTRLWTNLLKTFVISWIHVKFFWKRYGCMYAVCLSHCWSNRAKCTSFLRSGILPF